MTLLTGPSLGPEGSLLERARAGGYKVIVTPQLVRNPNVWRDVRGWRVIKKLCGEKRPQIVHTHSSKAGDYWERGGVVDAAADAGAAADCGAYDSWVAVSSVSEQGD